jgi:hypothetical protein
MKKIIAAVGLLNAALACPVSANEGPSPLGVNRLDHVFVIMMENHGYGQIMNNPNAPFINQIATTGNLATNYFGVAHPSLTNYLEVVGGSNFGIHSDNYPDWHNAACSTNLATAIPNTDNPVSSKVCPISGTGTDAATAAVDYTNETQNPAGENNIDGVQSIPASHKISGKTIADQLVAVGLSWKSYQENLPLAGADMVNYSDGVYTNNTDFTQILPVLNPPLTSAGIVALYAAKHNPFVYFKNIQEGKYALSMKQVVDFEGQGGLFADLSSGNVPAFSFIAPNQCNDQHGRGNAGPFCNYDPSSDGTQAGLNPALIQRGDDTVKRLVTAIQSSPVWKQSHSAIVVLWDENDYSLAPNTNQVPAIVITSKGKIKGMQSNMPYNHFSLLKSMESALGLPCLNHACDANVQVMSDLFN